MQKLIKHKLNFTILGISLGLLLTSVSCKCDLDDDENDKKEANTSAVKHENDSLKIN